MRRKLLLAPAFLLGGLPALAQVAPAGPKPALAPPPLVLTPPAQSTAPAKSEPVAQPPAPAAAPQGPKPAPAPLPQPELVERLRTFDPSAVQLVWSDRRWQLMTGTDVLKDFGRREAEARQAQRLILELGLTQYGTVGAPSPVMEYWLASGQAPHGTAAGLRVLPVDPATLRVEAMQSQWCLRDGQRVLFNFGLRAEEAHQALAIIRKYGFTEVGVVGQAVPSMMVFLAHDGTTVGLPARHEPTNRTHPTSRRPEAQVNGPKSPAVNNTPGAFVTPALPPLQPPPARHGYDGLGERAQHNAIHGQAPFVRAAAPPGLEGLAERVPFDWRQVQVRPDNGAWKLTAGGLVLADFGKNEADARTALLAVHHYHFTEQYRIGKPEPRCSWFLSNGQPPRGVMLGVPGVSFQADGLSVQQLGQRWGVCAGDQVLLLVGERQEEARQVLTAIQQNHFDRLCRLGAFDGQGMTFFVRSR
jgi:hypothetical protein